MIAVFDDVLPDPVAYRAAALAQTFTSVYMGPEPFHGIALCPDPALAQWFAAQFPTMQPTLTFFRQSPEGQVEPNFIHTDADMGDLTVILYLNPDPPAHDGTAFWRHRATGLESAPYVLGGDGGKDLRAWECVQTVAARFNRCVVFDSPLFHSRAIEANYGHDADARLIQVLFGRAKR